MRSTCVGLGADSHLPLRSRGHPVTTRWANECTRQPAESEKGWRRTLADGGGEEASGKEVGSIHTTKSSQRGCKEEQISRGLLK